MERHGDGNHWSALRTLLPAYRCITKVQIGDGTSTTFWWDSWLDDTSLVPRFSCLLSHCSHPDASISEVLDRGHSTLLVPRLSHQAANELIEVEALINNVELHQHSDIWSSKFARPLSNLDIAGLYRA
jgi:hypothetical protein